MLLNTALKCIDFIVMYNSKNQVFAYADFYQISTHGPWD